jgi:PAS domain S-box-containing protein
MVTNERSNATARGIDRAIAALRVAGVALLGALASLDPGRLGGDDRVVWVIGLVWLPAAALLLFAQERSAGRRILRAGAALDVALLIAVQQLTSNGLIVLLGGILFAGVLGYADRWVVGLLGGAAVLAGVIGSGTGLGADEVAAVGVTMLIAAAAGDAVARLQGYEVLRSNRARGRADAVLASVADAVVVTDGAGRLVQANPAATRLLGTADLGERCASLGLRRDDQLLDCSDGCALRGLTGSEAEVTAIGADGRERALLASADDVTGGAGEVVHSFRDITRMKEAEEAKTLFLATASHELKTPITVIMGFAQMIDRTADLDEDQRSALEVITRRAAELNRIVDRLLTASRIDAGHVEVACANVDVGVTVAERAGALAALGRPVQMDVPVGPVQAWADPQAVATVLDHLVDNAHVHAQGAEVVVSVTRGADGAVLRVADAGPGMDADHVEHCFDRFWQGHPSRDGSRRGTGVGLYIVRSLVEAMGGTVTVDSRLGEGTTFTVALRGSPPPTSPTPDEHGLTAVHQSEIRSFLRQLGVATTEATS